jgi:predicted ArsR family transcriptional regulator
MSNVTLKEKLLASFDNPVYNTFTTAQAAARYQVSPATVNAAIRALRLEGHAIYRNTKTYQGRTINVYRLGKPSKRFKRNMKAGRTQIALAALNGQV